MPLNDDLLGNYREMVATMRGNIISFEMRHMTLYGDRGGERVDITQEWKSKMKQQTYKLQRVIADLEGSPTTGHEPTITALR
jgi:hypothetical protein